MTSKQKSKIPYDEKPDDQKLEANWKKACGQFERGDWSAAIIRAATSAEIAANIYIRKFLIDKYELPDQFVDSLLKGANGLDGKFNRLIRPAVETLGTWNELKPLKRKIESLHDHRNGVVHSGKFKKKTEAKAAFKHAFEIIEGLASTEASKLTLPFHE